MYNVFIKMPGFKAPKSSYYASLEKAKEILRDHLLLTKKLNNATGDTLQTIDHYLENNCSEFNVVFPDGSRYEGWIQKEKGW